jgi:hypothetical protein
MYIGESSDPSKCTALIQQNEDEDLCKYNNSLSPPRYFFDWLVINLFYFYEF